MLTLWLCMEVRTLTIGEYDNHAQYERAPKRGLASLEGHSPCKHDILWKKWMSVEKNAGNNTFAALYCTIFRMPSFRNSLEFFGTSIASLDPETVQLPAFSILSAMFTGACGPTEKLGLALVPRSDVLRKIVKTRLFAYQLYKPMSSGVEIANHILEEQGETPPHWRHLELVQSHCFLAVETNDKQTEC